MVVKTIGTIISSPRSGLIVVEYGSEVSGAHRLYDALEVARFYRSQVRFGCGRRDIPVDHTSTFTSVYAEFGQIIDSISAAIAS